MKTCFLVFVLTLLFNVLAFSQSNPDGEYISLHISPFINTAANYKDAESQLEYEADYNFAIQMKIPINKFMTLSPFWEKRTFSYLADEVIQANTNTVTYKHTESKAGFTLSVYFNFFK